MPINKKAWKSKRPRLSVVCSHRWRWSTRFSTRARHILTSPPLTMDGFNVKELSADIVYIRLHGIKDQEFLYGDPGYITAIREDQISNAPDGCFTDSLVFMEGCFGAGFANEFLQAGALAVCGTDRVTYGRPLVGGPSTRVGGTWLRLVKDGVPVGKALTEAKRKVKAPFNRGWEIYGNSEAKLS